MEENFNIVGGLFRDIYCIFNKYYSNREEDCLKFVEDYYKDILELILKEIIEYNKFKRKIIKEVKDTRIQFAWRIIITYIIDNVYYCKDILEIARLCINNYKENGGFGDLELITGMLGAVMELNVQTIQNYNNVRTWIFEKGYDGRGLTIHYDLYEELKENIDDCIRRLTGMEKKELIKKRSM